MSRGAWNLLLYTVAESDDQLALVEHAIDDMHRAIRGECNVVVQVHAKKSATRYWLAAGHAVQPEKLPSADASEPDTLTKFLDAAHGKLPEASTALILWAHSNGFEAPLEATPGSAAARPTPFGARGSNHKVNPPSAKHLMEQSGCLWGPDPISHHYLTDVGMRKAIARSIRRRVEVLGLNACSMASLEVEYELRNVTDVQVASQVYATPWSYGAIITALAAAPAQSTEQVATAIVDSVRDGIAAPASRSDTVSALKSGPAVEEIAKAVDVYAKRALALIDSDWKTVFDAVMNQAWRVDDTYQVDLKSVVDLVSANDAKARTEATTVDSKLQKALVARADNPGRHPGLSGLSLFCPMISNVDISAAYQGMQFRSNSWIAFLQAFQRKLSRAPATP